MGLNDTERKLRAYIEQVWYTDGGVPSKEKCVSAGVCNTAQYSQAFKNADFRDSLVALGITLSDAGNTTGSRVLTPLQITVANAAFDLLDNKSLRKKLTELGVSTAKWEAWKRDPAFQQYLRSRGENTIGDHSYDAHLALVDRVRAGDLGAIKYYNEISGRFVPNGRDNIDINGVLLRILEVIQRHVTDPQIQGAIAEELMGLSRALAPVAPVGFKSVEPMGTRMISSRPVGDAI